MRDYKDGNNTLTYVLPDVVDPPNYLCITLRIPNNKWYIMAFKGAIWDLCNWWNWEKDEAHTATKVARIWRRVFYAMKFSDCGPVKQSDLIEAEIQMAIHVDCDCKVTIDCCDGTTKQLVTLDMLQGGTQPGGGTPQPPGGGGTMCYQGKMDGTNTWLVPVLVNSGDLFHLENATGAEYDGGGDNWRCPDGSAFGGGLCFETNKIHKEGDPSRAAFHMSLIVVIAGTAYPLAAGDFTVPGGVVNAQAVVQANDSDITNNRGSYSFVVCVTNNQVPPAAPWCHISNNLSDLGTYWAIIPGCAPSYCGAYDGTKWNNGAGVTAADVQIYNTTPFNPSTIITSMIFHTSNAVASGCAVALYTGYPSFGTLVHDNGACTTEAQTFLSGNTTYHDYLAVDLQVLNPAAVFAITSIEIRGTGPNPFGVSNC